MNKNQNSFGQLEETISECLRNIEDAKRAERDARTWKIIFWIVVVIAVIVAAARS